MRRVAYLTTPALVDFPTGDGLTVAPLRDRGLEVEIVDWRAPEEWGRFAAVLPRSPWDYHLHAEEFFAVLEQIEDSGTRLFNDIEVMRWNADKRYLAELAGRGLHVVETEYGTLLDPRRIEELRKRFGADLVLKPTVSASAADTFLVRAGADPAPAIAALDGRVWMAQPFMRGIVDEGEFSLIYFDGAFSHALVKVPRSGDFRVQENWGGATRPVSVESRMRERADEVVASLPSGLLYARIDLVRDDGDFALMEAELIEPSLFFGVDPEAPARFARALARRLGSGA